MRVFDELRGSLASFRRASKRSSSGSFSALAMALSSSRFLAYCATRWRTISLRFTALFLAISVLFPRSSVRERELEFGEESFHNHKQTNQKHHHEDHAPDQNKHDKEEHRKHQVLLQAHGVVAAAVE